MNMIVNHRPKILHRPKMAEPSKSLAENLDKEYQKDQVCSCYDSHGYFMARDSCTDTAQSCQPQSGCPTRAILFYTFVNMLGPAVCSVLGCSASCIPCRSG